MNIFKTIRVFLEDYDYVKRKVKLHGKCYMCPASWEERGYEGECYDCGCLIKRECDDYCKIPLWIAGLIVMFKYQKLKGH